MPQNKKDQVEDRGQQHPYRETGLSTAGGDGDVRFHPDRRCSPATLSREDALVIFRRFRHRP